MIPPSRDWSLDVGGCNFRFEKPRVLLIWRLR
jgi:hypothetical protein